MARASAGGEKGGPSGTNRTADEPGQTLNVDLCFVPATHATAARLPAVSGSSGRLVPCGPRPRAAEAAPTWPGQVFADPELTYGAAMHEFVQRSAPRTPQRKALRAARRQRQETAEQVARRTRREQQRRAAQRTPLLQQRQQEDTAWQAVCAERQARLRPAQWTPRLWVDYLTAEGHWLVLPAQRQATLARRQEEDAQSAV